MLTSFTGPTGNPGLLFFGRLSAEIAQWLPSFSEPVPVPEYLMAHSLILNQLIVPHLTAVLTVRRLPSNSHPKFLFPQQPRN